MAHDHDVAFDTSSSERSTSPSVKHGSAPRKRRCTALDEHVDWASVPVNKFSGGNCRVCICPCGMRSDTCALPLHRNGAVCHHTMVSKPGESRLSAGMHVTAGHHTESRMVAKLVRDNGRLRRPCDIF
jgi:hypothetical protein